MLKLGESKVNIRGKTSLAITIPKLVAENYDIKAGDTVEFVSVSNLDELSNLDLKDMLIAIVRREKKVKELGEDEL